MGKRPSVWGSCQQRKERCQKSNLERAVVFLLLMSGK
jgi:hypothetical protein